MGSPRVGFPRGVPCFPRPGTFPGVFWQRKQHEEPAPSPSTGSARSAGSAKPASPLASPPSCCGAPNRGVWFPRWATRLHPWGFWERRRRRDGAAGRGFAPLPVPLDPPRVPLDAICITNHRQPAHYQNTRQSLTRRRGAAGLKQEVPKPHGKDGLVERRMLRPFFPSLEGMKLK